MHNDGKSLEYFSLDFSDSSIAFHASAALNQAVFLNQAVEKIQSIYTEGVSFNNHLHIPTIHLCYTTDAKQVENKAHLRL